MKVTLEPYNPSWATKFHGIKQTLESILSDIPIQSIEHVGSTSIPFPNFLAKPVLDIDIIVPPASLSSARAALVKAGYFDCGEMNVPGRFAFRQPGYGQKDAAFGHGDAGGEMRMNSYVMVEGCTALRNHLDVKKVLMEDEALRGEYVGRKRELAKKDIASIGEYATAKTEILCKILRKAGWKEEELEPVKDANAPGR